MWFRTLNDGLVHVMEPQIYPTKLSYCGRPALYKNADFRGKSVECEGPVTCVICAAEEDR